MVFRAQRNKPVVVTQPRSLRNVVKLHGAFTAAVSCTDYAGEVGEPIAPAGLVIHAASNLSNEDSKPALAFQN